MRYSIRPLLFLAAVMLTMAACNKVENKIIFEGGTAPQLSSNLSVNSVIPLNQGTKANSAITLNWTNPDYKFNTGVSSQNVNYTLQVDKAGAGFQSSTLQEKTFSGDLSNTLTQDEVNKMMIQLGLPFDVESTIEMRVRSYLGDGSVALYSNVLTFKVIPFLDVAIALPTTGELYIVGGDAKLGGWANGGSFAVQNQQFTVTDLTTYTITVELSGGDNTSDKNQFLFVPKWGDWGHKFACKKTSEQPESGGLFGFDWSDNFPGPSTAGTYKIVVDFVKGNYTVTRL